MFEYESCWQKELAKTITDPAQLLALLNIQPEQYQAGFAARKLFPLRVPRPFIGKMEQGNIDDPLLKQVLTSELEFEEKAGFVADPLAEHESVIPGVLHKYKSRVLLMVKTGCAINCRYCFRRHFPYQENSLNKQNWSQVIEYLQQDTAINEVVLSGGDPLMATDKHLIELLRLIETVTHIKRVRFHTRLPVVIPQRITPELTQAILASRLKPVIVLHINHGNEIDDLLIQHLSLWRDNKITLLNQSVLLKGVNDSVSVLVDLSEKLFAAGILPYYIHLLDKVAGAAHFYRPDSELAQLQQGLLAELPGFLVPKWAREEAGLLSKSPVVLS
ncbi:EF-P beta-lysylation protein EpmB [Catenovulum sp. 2E275]|uniref:EF-P beta-lysylation protein EpmB n=1 Tax=Catenovulum sp. 2E275 TaxID=2980497 RepID=UPI0021D14359|nr:EF-P beta-lysylation protein EpmB [Catenovulum sp. 2E275]MCU4676307.1 EF-P beta-lysylation protein EpmB [Catenovulum sp. 2E275]